jgi:hypothetical protein
VKGPRAYLAQTLRFVRFDKQVATLGAETKRFRNYAVLRRQQRRGQRRVQVTPDVPTQHYDSDAVLIRHRRKWVNLLLLNFGEALE